MDGEGLRTMTKRFGPEHPILNVSQATIRGQKGAKQVQKIQFNSISVEQKFCMTLRHTSYKALALQGLRTWAKNPTSPFQTSAPPRSHWLLLRQVILTQAQSSTSVEWDKYFLTLQQ